MYKFEDIKKNFAYKKKTFIKSKENGNQEKLLQWILGKGLIP
jgi:hypothetical protein